MRTKIIIIAFTIISISSISIYAHKQHVHQYLTKEAYYQLRDYLGHDIPEMLAHLDNGPVGASWTNGTLLAGVWVADEYDAIYQYDENFFITWFPEIVQPWIFGDDADKVYVSITHFWDADNGNFTENTFHVSKEVWFATFDGDIGPFPNAYTKANLYKNGIYILKLKFYPYLRVQAANGDWLQFWSVPNFGFEAAGLMYYSLVDLYKNKRMHTNFTDNEYNRIYNERLQQWVCYYGDVYLSEDLRDKVVWEILGRMAHLLQDLSEPTHAHIDEHGAQIDPYEEWIAGSYPDRYQHYNHNNIESGIIDPYQSTNPLHFLMYTTQQISDHFGSRGPYNGDGDNILGGNPLPEEITYLNNIGLSSLGGRMDMHENFTDTELQNIRDKTIPHIIRATAGLLYWFAKEANILPELTISPYSQNVGTVKGNTEISGNFTITNTGKGILNGNITTINPYYDLDLSTPYVYESTIYFYLNEGESKTISYKGLAPAYYGPFTEIFNIQTSIGLNKTFTIVGNVALPEFCYGETKAMAASPEEQLFNKEFTDYFALSNDSLYMVKDKSIKERLGFAYDLLKQPETESVDKICKMIIDLYPESEMGISFYAMGLLWEASYSKEAPNFNEKDFKSYLKELTERKEKYKINGYAQLILSLSDVGNDITGLERLFSDYDYKSLKELALFHQFIHYYIYKQDEKTAREISAKLDKIFADSKYGYQIHLIIKDKGYTLGGLKELLKKKQLSLLAKRGESKNDVLSEMPKKYKLYNNYPNPFNPVTTIKYSVPKNSSVKLSIYNMMGQLVRILVNEHKTPGFYNVEWNGTNENNSQVSSGIYFYRFESDNFIANNKMILLK